MSRSPRILLICCFLAWLSVTCCNIPSDAPADADPPAIRASSVAFDVHLADSLSLHGAPLAALERYRAVEAKLRTTTPDGKEGLGWLWIRMARTLIRSDQPEAAAAQLDTVIANLPESRWAAQAHRELGRMLSGTGQYARALPHLLKAAGKTDGADGGRLAFLIAYAYQRTKQWSAALAWYDHVTYPALGDYALFYAAQCLMRLDRREEAVARLRRIEREYSGSLFLAAAAATLCAYDLERGDTGRALEEARAVLAREDLFDPERRAALIFLKGRAHEAAGSPDSARQTYRAILETYRETGVALEALSALDGLPSRPGKAPSDADRLREGRTYLAHRHYGKAKQAFLPLVRDASTGPSVVDSDIRANAEYYLRRTQYLTRQYRTAEQGFRRFLKKYPDHEKAAGALLHLARCIRARKGVMRSLTTYLEFAGTYPDDPRAPDALLYVAQRLESAARYAEAAKGYLRLVADYPGYADAEEAHWRAGYCYYRMKQYRRASAVFRRLAGDRPRSGAAPRALYWAAKAAHKQNLSDAQALYREVVAKYPGTYFAYRSREMLDTLRGKPAQHRLSGRPDGAWEEVTPWMIDPMALGDRFRRETPPETDRKLRLDSARALLEAGLRKEADEELQRVYARNRNHPPALVEITRLYYRYRLYREGIRSAARLRRVIGEREGTDRTAGLLPFLYPSPFWTLIQKSARTFHLDPLFLLAIMRQESRFDTGVTSRAGARGLMQLMPSTAKHLARQLRIRNFSARRLYEPEIGTLLGARYISDQLTRFHGRPELALAAYNGGPNRVSRWVRKRGARDIDEFVERIGVSETEDFVKSVMRNYARYAYLLRDEGAVQGTK